MADNAASGNLTAAWDGATPATAPAGSIVLLAPGRDATVGIDVRGTFVATVTLETSVDGLNWSAPSVTTIAGAGSTSTFTAPGSRLVAVSGASLLRARCSAYTSGTATVVMAGTPGGGGGASGGGGGGGGAVTVADGADVAEGSTADAPLVTVTTGATAATVIGLLRGLVNIFVQPVMAIAHGANPPAVAAAARSPLYANRAGVPFMIGGHPNVQAVTANFTAAQTDTALVTVATGLKIVVTGFIATTSNANTVNTSLVLGFGTVNTPTLTANTPVAAVIGSHPGIAPGSGFGRGGGSGILGVGADDADLRVTCSVPTGGSLSVTVSFYTIES